MSDLQKLQFNNRTILTPSRDSFVAFQEPPALWKSFYFITYFKKASTLDPSITDNRIRGYSLGQIQDVTPTSSMNYYVSETADYGKGTMNYVGNSSKQGGSFHTYWTQYILTAAQGADFVNGNIDLQFELMYYQNGSSGGGNDGSGGSSLGNIANSWNNFWMFGMQSNGQETTIYSQGISNPANLTSYDSTVSVNTNTQWRYFRRKYSNFANKCTHLCYTISLSKKKLLYFVDGKLCGKMAFTDNWITPTKNNISNGTMPGFFLDPAKYNTNMRVSQFVIRPAVWTEEQSYTAPTEPYMSVDEYY